MILWEIDFQKTLFLSQSFPPSGQGNDSTSRDIQRKEPWSRFSKVDFQVSSRGHRHYQHLSFSQKLKYNRPIQTCAKSKLLNLNLDYILSEYILNFKKSISEDRLKILEANILTKRNFIDYCGANSQLGDFRYLNIKG